MMDVEAQVMAMNIDAQLSNPVAVRGRQMTVEAKNNTTLAPTPIHCVGPYPSYQPRGVNSFRDVPTVDDHRREHHPMAACCNLIPFVDTTSSHPPHERGFLDISINDLLTPYTQPKKVSVGVQILPSWAFQPPLTPVAPPSTPMMPRSLAHFPTGQQAPNGTKRWYFTDCMICGKPYEQIANEIVIDCNHHTEYPGEPYYVKEARWRAFVEGMHEGTYFLIPRGESQAADCDGNVQAIPQNAVETNRAPSSLPLEAKKNPTN